MTSRSRSGSSRNRARSSNGKRGPRRSARFGISTKRFNASNEPRIPSRDADHFHLPFEDLQLLFLDGPRSQRDDEGVLALGDGIQQTTNEFDDGVEGVVRNQVLDSVDQHSAPRLLGHEVLNLVHDPLERRRDPVFPGSFPVGEPEDPFGGQAVGFADSLRIRPRDDESPTAATEEGREPTEGLRGSIPATRPDSKREMRRSSRFAIAFGGRSLASTICFSAPWSSLKAWNSSSWTSGIPLRNWISSMRRQSTPRTRSRNAPNAPFSRASDRPVPNASQVR